MSQSEDASTAATTASGASATWAARGQLRRHRTRQRRPQGRQPQAEGGGRPPTRQPPSGMVKLERKGVYGRTHLRLGNNSFGGNAASEAILNQRGSPYLSGC